MRLRGRFALWFSVAALVPVTAAALITRELVSRSYKNSFRESTERVEGAARRALRRREGRLLQVVTSLAHINNKFAGGTVVELQKNGGRLSRPARADLKQSAPSVMTSLGLQALSLVDGSGRILAAPHNRPAVGELNRELAKRARLAASKAYYTRELMYDKGKPREELVVPAARTVKDGSYEVLVAVAFSVGTELLDSIPQQKNTSARIIDANGKVIATQPGPWNAANSKPIRLPLRGADGKPEAWLEIAISDTELRELLTRVTQGAAGLAGAAVVLMILLGFIMARRITRDLDKLVEGAQAASRGELDHRIDVRRKDEIAAVAKAFNRMMSDLGTSEDKLRIAERIAAWQEIARRLAHEIKNPLTPIRMSMETLRKTWKSQHPSFQETFDESTAMVLEETDRLKRIVTEFAEFARLPKPELADCSLNDIVAGAASLYAGTTPIVKDLADGLPNIVGDKDQLTQLVINLIENARDAVANRSGDDGGGQIWLTTRMGPDSAAGAQVEFIVDDNGPGISDDHRDKLFTPYFTTKHGAGGTGLGLAIVHRIVSDHSGQIACGEAPTGGARFVVSLPSA